MEFDEMLAEQQIHSEAIDKAWKYLAEKRHTREERRTRCNRAAKAVAAGVALAIPVLAVLTAPAFGAAEASLDKLSRPAFTAAVEAQEEAENELIEAALLARSHKMENVKVTYYDPCVKCCGKSDGITASGITATPYVTCAVDPAVIPLGSDVLVDYGDGVLHYLRADDTGVAGGHIDIFVTTHSEALWLGVDRATVYWVEQ